MDQPSLAKTGILRGTTGAITSPRPGRQGVAFHTDELGVV